MDYNLLVILGPTASGKTRLAVEAAQSLNGEIISADSRQVYRGMDIGTGKDLGEYGKVPHHLIDILEPCDEFSLFTFQELFYQVFAEIDGRGRLPLLVGGTGLYLDAVLSGYQLTPVPVNEALRRELAVLAPETLRTRLMASSVPHNSTDLKNRERLIRAIEIAEHARENLAMELARPLLKPVVFGIRWERHILRQRITERLQQRLSDGMIDEVEQLLGAGIPATRLEFFGLEYRYICRYLRGEMSRKEMVQQLNSAIHDFAKRQETWFRRMERRGLTIHWLTGSDDAIEGLLHTLTR